MNYLEAIRSSANGILAWPGICENSHILASGRITVAFGNVPALQVYVVKHAERFAPHSVPVASGMNIAAFNLGVAGRAWTGGVVVSHVGLMQTPWIGAVVVHFALLLTWFSGSIDRREEHRATTSRSVR